MLHYIDNTTMGMSSSALDIILRIKHGNYFELLLVLVITGKGGSISKLCDDGMCEAILKLLPVICSQQVVFLCYR